MTSRILIILLAIGFILPAGCGKYHRMAYHRGMDARVEGAKSEVNTLLQDTIRDPSKAKRAQEIIGQIFSEVKQLRQKNRDSHQLLYNLNANYDAERDDFTTVLDQMSAQRRQAALTILDLRFELTEQMTESEWKAFTDGLAEMRSRYRPPHKEKD